MALLVRCFGQKPVVKTFTVKAIFFSGAKPTQLLTTPPSGNEDNDDDNDEEDDDDRVE